MHNKQELKLARMVKQNSAKFTLASPPVCNFSPSVVPVHFLSAFKHASYIYTSYFTVIVTFSTCIILELKGESQCRSNS